MKQYKNKCMFFCVLLLTVLGMASLLSYLTGKIFVEQFQIDNSFIRLIVYDKSVFEKKKNETDHNWQKKYPIDNNECNYDEKDLIDHITIFEHKGNQPADKLNDFIKSNMYGYFSFLEVSKKIEDWINWQELPVPGYHGGNNVVKLQDGSLIFFHSKHNVSRQAMQVVNFYQWCKDQGIPFLYVQLPTKCMPSKYTNDIREKLDKANEEFDEMVKIYQENCVPYVDIRDNIIADKLLWHNLFFRTDHHWKIEAGMWSTEIILNKLNSLYHFDIKNDVIKSSNFVEKNFENAFLGSQGKKISLGKATPEDISILLPKFKTDVKYTVLSKSINMELRGDLSIYYNLNAIKEDIDYYDDDSYNVYAYNNDGMSLMHNYLSSNHLKVLMIRDSFSRTIFPFIGLSVEELHAVDKRSFNGSIKRYIDEYKPDLVLIIYGDGPLWDSPELFDFR